MRPRPARRRAMVAAIALASSALVSTTLPGAADATPGPLRSATPATAATGAGQPDFGPNVIVFDPTIPTSAIQAGRRHRQDAGIEPVRPPLCAAVPARPLRDARAARRLPGRLLHRGRRPWRRSGRRDDQRPGDASRAFAVPRTAGVRMHDLMTISLDRAGTIDHVVDDTGASVTPTFLGPSTVVIYS